MPRNASHRACVCRLKERVFSGSVPQVEDGRRASEQGGRPEMLYLCCSLVPLIDTGTLPTCRLVTIETKPPTPEQRHLEQMPILSQHIGVQPQTLTSPQAE